MKHLLIGLGIVSLLGVWGGKADAAERASTQKAFGGINTASAVVSGSAQVITGVSIQSTGSAAVVGLYNTDGLNTASNALGVWEGGAAANASTYTAFDPPIRTTTGVTMVGTNIAGVVVYTEQATP